MFVTCLICLFTARLQSSEVNVSAAIRATNLRLALKELSKSSGRVLAASTEIQNQIVTIKVKDRSLRRVMNELAEVTGSTVEATKDGGYQLTRSKDLQKALEKEEYSQLERRIRDSQKQAIEKVEKQMPGTDAYLQLLRLSLASEFERGQNPWETSGKVVDSTKFPSGVMHPGSVFVARMYAAIKPSVLARMENQDVSTFAYPANKLQSPLSAEKARQALDEFNRTMGTLRDEISQDKPFYRTSPLLWYTYFEPLEKTHDATKIIVRVRKRKDSFLTQLTSYDADGQQIHSGWVKFEPEPDRLPSAESFAVKLPKTMDPPELSDLGEEYAKVSPKELYDPRPYIVDKPSEAKLSNNLKKLLTTSDQLDPLSTLSTDLLWQLAEKTGNDIVACIPDSFDVVARWSIGPDKFNWDGFVTSSELLGGVRFKVDSGALIVQPRRPIFAEREQLDRKASAKFFKDGYQKGVLDMRLHCKLEYEAGYPAYDGVLLKNLRGIAHAGGMPVCYTWMTYELHRLIGSLPDDKYGHLLSGGYLTIDGLNASQRDMLLKWMSGWPAQKPGATEWTPPPLMYDCTELLASASSNNLRLRMTKNLEYRLIRAGTQEHREDIGNLAGYAAGKIFSGEWKSLDDYSPDGFYVSQINNLIVSMRFNDQAEWKAEIEDSLRDDTSKKRSYSELPVALRKQFEEALAQNLDRLKRGGG